MNESLPKAFADNLTAKANQLYEEAHLAFKEYEDDCVWDMLDNYYDFLLASDDNFLDLFDITYNKEIVTDEDGTRYSDTEIVLTPKVDHKIEPLYVLVTGYVVPRNGVYNGFGIQCYVNENCRQQGRNCVKLMKKLLGVTDD